MLLLCIISNSYTAYFRKSSHISRYHFLGRVLEEVETGGKAVCDVVILPPPSSNLDVSDEQETMMSLTKTGSPPK